MDIRLLVSRCGPKINQNAGDILKVGADVSEAEASRMIDAGQAEAVGTRKSPPNRKQKAEKATKRDQVETADN